MRTINELREEELQELRSRYYHQLLDDGSIDEVMDKEINDESEIPMGLVKEYYSDTYFVEEDFWVNLK